MHTYGLPGIDYVWSLNTAIFVGKDLSIEPIN
jgi:hypothetical protein